MSKLNDLLKNVKVEWLPLGEFADYEQPTKYLVKSKNYHNDYDTPVLTAGKTFILGYTDEKDGINKASEKPVIIFDDFTTANKWVDFDFKAKSSAMKIIKSKDEFKASLRYIYYWINSLPSDLVDGDHKRQWISNYSNKLIPIPCPDNPEKSLEIQQEIVRMLDQLTETTTNLKIALENERQNRKKQFEFYSEHLFSFEEGVAEWKTLGDNDIFKISSGGTPSTSKDEYWNEGSIPWLRSESCNNKSIFLAKEYISQLGLNNSSAKLLEPRTTLIALVGATIFKTGFLEFSACTNQNIASIKSLNPEIINDKYVFKYITSLYEHLKSQMKNYGMLNLTTLRTFKIPIPSLEEQEHIVNLLDQFNAAHTAIDEEISKEIKLRTQQYEYYREKLLTFAVN